MWDNPTQMIAIFRNVGISLNIDDSEDEEMIFGTSVEIRARLNNWGTNHCMLYLFSMVLRVAPFSAVRRTSASQKRGGVRSVGSERRRRHLEALSSANSSATQKNSFLIQAAESAVAFARSVSFF